MGAIKITVLDPVVVETQKATYKDIHLDFEIGSSRSSDLFKQNEVKDLKEDLDYNAIRTSLFNLFNTNQGERLLTPEYGLNLRKLLFSPISRTNGILIGDAIKSGIKKYEPRVNVDQVIVVADEDNSQYLISLSYTVPALQSKTVQLAGILNTTGYSIAY